MNFFSAVCFVFAAASVSVYASVNYTFPALPCAWTLTSTTNESYAFYSKQSVSGNFSYDLNVKGGIILSKMVFRDDLASNSSNIAVFGYAEGTTMTREFPIDFAKKMSHYPKLYGEFSFDFEFEGVEDDAEWYGVSCQKYYNSLPTKFDLLYLYVKDGFPIGAVEKDRHIELNFTFSEGADLKDFAFDTSVPFSDTRIYTPPTKNPCYKEPPVNYTFPALPCAWTFSSTRKSTTDTDVCEYKTSASGKLILVYVKCTDESDYVKYVVRDDLGATPPNITYFVHTDGNNFEGQESIEDYADMAKPTFSFEFSFDFEFEGVEDDAEWYGVSCQKYYNGKSSETEIDYLYVKNGFPIGAVDGDNEFNFTFSEGADLKDFAFDTSVPFSDNRIYTPPTKTICVSKSSSANSANSATSTTISVNLSSSSLVKPAALVFCFIAALVLLF